ncbi:hypothetical protein CAS74_005137 [Pichia kudriavzevii]|uniref:Uncharacterized protein n=1 Tax=Pichia kudriavzevii TaxID=4909 RepID=A0A1Z8JGZ7_PICKU|nr:hypothetical protein CAS74_005129 [Pichia kudriavzevii]OUT19857.1 hypothetical protein CAS74_005132 [Pichia kudriavzevii]OUT19860.1 hypothetical protein CAS74_005137 [Pichia kudriavzevii]
MRVFGCETRTRNESERRSDPLPSGRGARSTDPDVYRKDLNGELCLNRVKPEETLVEARSGSDVQIDRRIWV